MNKISWTKPMLERFKKAWKLAQQQEGESFMFEENKFQKGYAKYLIEYLEGLFANVR